MDAATLTAAAVAAKNRYGRQAPLIPVASRPNNYTNGLSSAAGSSTAVTYRRAHYVTVTCTDIVLTFGNWYNNNGARADGPNQITITASVQAPDGTIYPAYFPNGLRSITLDGGAVVDTLPIAAAFPVGTALTTLTSVSVSTGNKWPVGLAADGGSFDTAIAFPTSFNGEGDNSVAATGDVTMTAGNTTATNNVFGYSPQAIHGRPLPGTAAPNCWAIAGDSWTVGGGDTNHDRGWCIRMLQTTRLGHVSLGAGNSGAVFLLGSSGRPVMASVKPGACSHAFLAHGTNDRLGNSTTRTNYTQNVINEALGLVRRGVRKVYVPTIGPRVTTTDSYATTANQTPVANEADRIAWNAWIRGGLPVNSSTLVPVAVGTGGALLAGQNGHPVAGYLEVADVLESARDSGLWKVNGSANFYTADGVHPSAAAHAAIAAALPALTTL